MTTLVMDDGFWYENSFGYHYLAQTAFQFQTSIAWQQGSALPTLLFNRTDGLGFKSLKTMLITPIYLAMPNWNFPNLNDGGGFIHSNFPNEKRCIVL